MREAAPLLELVGVAGAGKTTLFKTLKQREPGLATVVNVETLHRVELLIRHTARFLPAFLRHSPRGRWLSWEEMRSMAYLEGWRRTVGDERTSSMVLDHGPIFRLVQLREFGPPLVASPAFRAWWNAERRAWARALDLVVWLDAPDAVVLSRISGREQRHAVKQMPAAAAVDFLTSYRKGYERLLAEMSEEGCFPVTRFDTSRTPPEAIAEEVLVAVRRKPVPKGELERPRQGGLS